MPPTFDADVNVVPFEIQLTRLYVPEFGYSSSMSHLAVAVDVHREEREFAL